MAEKEQPQADEIDVKKLILLVLHKWYVFAIAVCACCMVAMLYYFCTARQYATSATIMLRSENNGSMLDNLSIAGFTAAELGIGGGRQIDNEIEIIRSRKLIQQAIDELGIRTTIYRKNGLRYVEQYHESPLQIVYPDGFIESLRGSLRVDVKKNDDNTYRLKFVRKILRNKTRFKCNVASLDAPIETPWGKFRFVEIPKNIPTWDEPDETTYTVRFNISSLKGQIENLAQQISVTQTSKKADMITLSYTSSNPQKNEALITKMIDLYNRGELEDKNRLKAETMQFLDDRLTITSEELLQAENNLENYKKGRDIANVSAQTELYIKTASEYEKRIAETDLQYSLVSFVENYLRDAKDSDLIPANTGIRDETLGNMMDSYNALVMKYLRISRSTNETNPVVEQTVNQIRLMRKNILQTINNVKESINITKQDLTRKKNEFAHQIKEIPTVEREYVSIARERELKQAIYLTLLKQRELTQMQLSTTLESARVINPAYTFEAAVAPKLKILLALAIMFGCALGAGYLYVQTLFVKKNDK